MMRHEDFNSLEVESVIGQVLAHAQKLFGGQVHWLSSKALGQISEQREEDWLSGAFEALLGRHAISLPQGQTFDLLHVWFRVAAFARPFKAQMLNSAPTKYFVYPLNYDGQLCGVMLFENFQTEFPKKMVEQLQPSMELAARYVYFAYTYEAAKELSYTDDLTGLNNQRYLLPVLAQEIERAKRDDGVFSLLFLDLDHFKKVNDNRGHLTGSRLLGTLGKLLRDQVRASDHAFRYGGDEFVLVLSGSSAENAAKVAERVRAVVEQTRFVVDGQELHLTVSIGVASFPGHGQSAQELIRVADQAMYSAKKTSRNYVFVAPKAA